MINKIFFMILIFVGGFAFLITLAGYSVIQMKADAQNDPCGFRLADANTPNYNSSTGLSGTSTVSADTTNNKDLPGVSEIKETGGSLFCYIRNIGAYSNSISEAFGIPQIIIDILNTIFTIIIILGIFWLVYYIVSAFSGIIG